MKLKLQNPKDFIRQLKNNGKPFKIVSTTLTKTIVTDSSEYYYSPNSGLKLSELNLIKAVKDHIVKNNIRTRSVKKNIQYINRNNLKNATYKKDLYEIDLKSAYWNFAYKNKFITKDIYNKGNDKRSISKKARLIALGNLAKRKTTIEFNGVEFSKPVTEESGMQDIFFKVSQQTDTIMNKCKLIAGEEYLFYWVDAIFIQGKKSLLNIKDYLKSENIEFKVLPVDKILKTNSYIKVWDQTHAKPRPFLFESLKIKDLSKIVD